MKDAPVISSSGLNVTTSLSLLERARARDEAAWRRLAELYEPVVLRWCRRADLDDTDAADVRQEVFLAVAARIGEFRRGEDGQTFRGWLRAIARNKIYDVWRKKPANHAPTGGSDAYEQLLEVRDRRRPDHGDAEFAEEAAILYRKALELVATDFQEVSWKAFWRVVIDGQPPAGVARDLQITRNAVYIAKCRVLQRLREEFRDLIDG